MAMLNRVLKNVALFCRLQPLGALGLLIILVMATCAVFAEQVTFYNPEAVDFGAMLSGPSADHPFGTDSFGRDIFTRIVYGARTALTIGFLSSMIGCHIGAAIGIASAFHGGWIDLLLQRFIDIILSFPIVVLALVVVAVMVGLSMGVLIGGWVWSGR